MVGALGGQTKSKTTGCARKKTKKRPFFFWHPVMVLHLLYTGKMATNKYKIKS